MESKKIIFTLLLLLGVIFRVTNIGSLPSGVFADEIALAINAKTLAENGVDEFGNSYPFGFESFADYKLPGYIYSAMLSYKVFGPTMLAIRFPAMVASVFSIFLVGYLAHSLFPDRRYTPYAAAIILAFSPFHIHFGRIAYETMLATMLLLVYLICLVQSIHKPKPLWFIFGSMTLLFSAWTYHAPRFIIPVFTGSLFLYFMTVKAEGINRRKAVMTSGYFLIISLVSFLPFLFNPEIDKRPLSYVTGDGSVDMLASLLMKGEIAFSSWMRMWNLEFLFTKGDLFGFRHGTGESGVFLSLFVIPLVAGIITFVKHFSFKRFSYIFLIVLMFTAGLPSALTSLFPYGPRFLPAVIPLTLLIAFGVDSLWMRISEAKPVYRRLYLLTGTLLLVYQLIQFAHIYTAHFSHKSLPEFPDAPVAMSTYIKEQMNSYPPKKIYFLTGAACLSWGYDELKLWYFADLDNEQMIKWNNLFREKRFATGNPFGSFDTLQRPAYSFGSIVFHSNDRVTAHAPAGSLIVRCGVHLPSINTKKETIKQVYYMYQQEQRDPVYIISEMH